MVEKTFHFLKDDGELALQEKTSLFKLSVILEEFVSEFESNSNFSSEIALAKRLDEFIWSDNINYFDF